MNTLSQLYWARALKIARQFEAGDLDFADLTGLGDEFAASFTHELGNLPESARDACCGSLESRLNHAIDQSPTESLSATALSELRLSLSKTPIY